MTEFRHKCDFFVLQCTPDPLKGEKVNVGVVLRDSNAQNPTVLVRLSERLKRIQCLEPGFDVEAFEEILHQADSVLRNALDFEQRPEQFEEWPEELVLAPKMAVLTNSMTDEIELLANQYLKPRSWEKGATEEETRSAILAEMRNCFENAEVWNLMDKRLPVAEFTRRGDTLKLDCGYVDRANSIYRVFHAVPLVKDCNVAKALAYSWPMIRDGMAAKQKLSCDMRVIVSNNLDRNDEAVMFGLETMERAGLITAQLSQVPEFAEQARIALCA
ncbi:MAG: DUF3037 domain-containing protein [Terriglobales bacterium]